MGLMRNNLNEEYAKNVEIFAEICNDILDMINKWPPSIFTTMTSIKLDETIMWYANCVAHNQRENEKDKAEHGY